jgi:hypothetical protein
MNPVFPASPTHDNGDDTAADTKREHTEHTEVCDGELGVVETRPCLDSMSAVLPEQGEADAYADFEAATSAAAEPGGVDL